MKYPRGICIFYDLITNERIGEGYLEDNFLDRNKSIFNSRKR
jgi:hypothetical protein